MSTFESSIFTSSEHSLKAVPVGLGKVPQGGSVPFKAGDHLEVGTAHAVRGDGPFASCCCRCGHKGEVKRWNLPSSSDQVRWGMGACAGSACHCVHFPPVLQGPLSGHPHLLEQMDWQKSQYHHIKAPSQIIDDAYDAFAVSIGEFGAPKIIEAVKVAT